MSYAANPNKQKKSQEENEAAEAARQQKEDRKRIRRLIITLGDEQKKVLGQIRGLAGALEDDVELHGELMADTVLECAKHLPLKTPIFAALVARMADKHPDWVCSMLARVLEDLRICVRSGRVMMAELLLRFVVAAGNCGILGLDALLTLLQEVLALSDGLRPAKGGDLGVFLALASLPFLSPAAYGKVSQKVDALVAKADAYLASRGGGWKPLLLVLKSDEKVDRLEALAASLRSMKEAGWSSQSILHVPGFEVSLEGSLPDLELTPLGITAEEVRKSKVRMQVPIVTSRLVTRTLEKDGSDDQMSEHDRWILEDYILLTMENFGKDVEECSKQVLRIPVLHPHFESIVVETILSQMMRLPSPALLPLFYSRLLEAIMEKQETTKAYVEQAYKSIFDQASELDEESLEVVSEAFAYHLMQSGYKHDWSHLTRDSVSVQAQRFVRRALERLLRLSFHQNLLHRLPEALHVYVPPEPLAASGLPAQSKPELAKMQGLVKIKDPSVPNVLKYCRRLQKLEAKEEFDEKEEPAEAGAGLTKAKEEEGDGDDAARAKRRKLDEEGGEEATKAADEPADGPGGAKRPRETMRVKEEVKEEEGGAADKADEDEVMEELPGEAWTVEQVVELFTMALLQTGSKTPTHMGKVLDGYTQVFLKLRPEEDDESYTKTIVRCVFEFWQASGQRLEITLDTMLHRGILTPQAVVEYALSSRGPQGCDSMAVWNMINSVARKSLEHSMSVRAELAIAKKLGKADVMEKCRVQLDGAIHETAELFTRIFTGLVRNHQDFEDKDVLLRHIMLQRVLTIGRKYHAFIKPLIDAAESRIPGVAHNPDVAAVFGLLGTL